MFKGLLISIVILPVLLGVTVGGKFRGPRAVALVVATFFAYCVLYLFLLRYLHYRWGSL